MVIETDDAETRELVTRYVVRFNLPTERLKVTTDRATFGRWLGRPVGAALGGGYAYHARSGRHLVLINLERIDRTRPRSVEIVVAEELMHMRDRLDGDLRRHAKHGHDRIAYRVAAMTGATLDEVRGCLKPVERRAARYLYGCPRCGRTVRRRRRGVWSCGSCAPGFDASLVLRLIADDGPGKVAAEPPGSG